MARTPAEHGHPGSGSESNSRERDCEFAYVGSVVPDTEEYRGVAFSRAGNMFQSNLLRGMATAGLQPSLILSFAPVRTFPHARRLWVKGCNEAIPGVGVVTLVGFLNLTPIKQVFIGISVLARLLSWAFRRRRAKQRIVYAFNLSVPPGIILLAACRAIRARLVVSINDINIPGSTIRDSLPGRIDYWQQRWVIPRLDGHVAVSDAIMEDFAPGRPYLRLEGGILPEVFAGAECSERRDETFVIAAAGSLDEVNGFPEILEAFSRIANPDCRLRIAGGGPLESLVRAAVTRDSRIEYLGFVPLTSVLQLYRDADVLLCMRPTRRFQTRYFFPSKLIECLASGTPVITTCTGHTREEFGEFCYLLEDETAEGLAERIREVAAIPAVDRRRLGARAREFTLRTKSWEAQSRRVVEYLSNVVAGH